jgi:hypothetical protein
MSDDPLLELREEQGDETPRKRWRRKAVTVVLLCIPLQFCACVMVASISSLQSKRFVDAWNGCADAVDAALDVLTDAGDDAEARRVEGLPERAGSYPGLSDTFGAMQSKCFDDTSLRGLEGIRAEFFAMRDFALDAWRHAKSPAVDAAPGLSGEEKLLQSAFDFVGDVLVPRLDALQPPSLLESIGIGR